MSPRSISLSDDLSTYIRAVGTRESEVQRRLREETQAMGSVASMQISAEQGQFLALLAKLIGAKTAIEVGTFTGYSALCVADAMGADGRLIACDVSEEWTITAQRYWEMAGIADRIDLRIAPAAETLKGLVDQGFENRFDLALIDADKQNYQIYYEQLLRLVRPGGLIMVDNVLWNGSVVDPDNVQPSTNAIRQFNQFASQDDRVDLSLVPIGDGMTLLRKR